MAGLRYRRDGGRMITPYEVETWLTEIAVGRPFENYDDQPDTAERVRLAVQSIPFGLPEKKREEAECP